MNVIVTDAGFQKDDWNGPVIQLAEAAADTPLLAVDLPSDADPAEIAGRLKDIRMIRVDFPSFSDGRGFTLAKRLRMMGYEGRLRAYGHVIADQYAMARRSGFDEVEIPQELSERQPEDQWLRRADWRSHDYQSRLGRQA